jgi:anti-sigma factor RsiW
MPDNDMLDKCPKITLLRRFVIGELVGAKFEQVAEHVTSCEACANAIAGLDDYSDELVTQLKRFDGQDSQPADVPEEILAAALTANENVRDSRSSSVTLDPGRAYARRLGAGPVRLGQFG